ncbi:hypothetical protein [Nocardia sp. NPDC046763]|uniref:hypothetical protein n=1 Tax=Nocardia sp. NPDC046763 TaxID=3155256 RepID=UPI0033C116A0
MAVGAVRERPDTAGEEPAASNDGTPGLTAAGAMPFWVLAGLLVLSISVIFAFIGGTLWAALDRPGGAETPDTPPASTSTAPESVKAQPQAPSPATSTAPAPPSPAPAAAPNPAPAPAPSTVPQTQQTAPQTQQYVPPPAPVEVAPEPPAPAPAPAAPPPAPALPDILAPILPFLVPPPPPPPAP